MKKKLINLGLLIIVITALVLYFTNPFRDSDYEAWSNEVSYNDYKTSIQLLQDTIENGRYTYFDYLETAEIDYTLGSYDADLTSTESVVRYDYEGSDVADLSTGQTAEYEVYVDDAGYYNIDVDYIVTGNILNNVTLSVMINGEYQYDDMKTVDVVLYWRDAVDTYALDKYGDETLPAQIKVEEWRPLELYNNTYTSYEPLLFYFEEGLNTITFENVSNGDLKFGDLEVNPPQYIETYAEYISEYTDVEEVEAFIEINATDYLEKNSSYVRLTSINNPSVEPFDSTYKKLNAIDGNAWYQAGQEVTYEVTVLEDGLYDLSFHYANYKNDFDVFRSIKIDGDIPFREFSGYQFGDTGNGWDNETLKDDEGNAYKVFLSAGTHTITIRAEKSELGMYLRDFQLMIDHINEFALEIIKITGKDIDENRTWKLTEYIPETESFLIAYDNIIKYNVVQMSEYSEKSDLSATLSYLKRATVELAQMLEKPDELPLYLNNLYSGEISVTLLLGDSLSQLADQQLYLDKLYVSNDGEFSNPNAGFFARSGASLTRFFNSFFNDKFVIENKDDVIDVWVNRPLTYVDIMQKMADSTFTEEYGYEVAISVMPDPNKLILANSAGNTPDVALGLLSYMPFDLAIRGAVVDLTQFEDYWSFADNFAPGAIVPYVLDDNVYAIPETLEFHALVYRKDVFNALDLEVPDTWDDVIGILPTLQRYNMNFYYPTSGGTSLKWFYQTTPLIYQYGGDIYSSDGLTTTIDSEESVAGLQLLGDLYTTYSLPAQVPVFYNSFRYNKLPIGIIDFNTYMQLKNAAPELVGQWELAPYPGVYNEETDQVERWYVGNGTGGVMFNTADNKEAAWLFMKWWMSVETQSEFAYTLQATYGPEFLWLSGNINAVISSPIENQDKQIILEQINWLRDVPRTPGQYMLERGLSDIWNNVTFEGVPVRVAIDRQVIDINREITRKMVEFGYLDNEGNVLKEFTIRDVDWIKEQIEQAKEGED
jgi:ABC-type glycerol-3-phosphate transport system substrate-binding protein